MLLYRGTGLEIRPPPPAEFAAHGWAGSWVDGVFGFHHFHSTSHEVLAASRCLPPSSWAGRRGKALRTAGDVARRRIWAVADDGFTVVGACPRGQEDYDLLR